MRVVQFQKDFQTVHLIPYGDIPEPISKSKPLIPKVMFLTGSPDGIMFTIVNGALMVNRTLDSW